MIDGDVARLFAAGQAARKAGDAEAARQGFAAVLARQPEHGQALNALGILTLDAGDAAAAAVLFRRAIAVDPAAPELRLNLARAHRLAGDDASERSALQAALAIDQRHLMALVRLAELHERRGEQAAAERWQAVATLLGQIDQRTPALDALLERATRYLAERTAAFGAAMDAALAGARTAIDPSARRRFDACVDAAVGCRRIYANDCAGLHFPFLPAEEFFDEGFFPWFATLRAEWRSIRAELEALLSADSPGFAPYVSMAAGTPANKWSPLDGSPAWSALHLWKDGRRIEENIARCPHTAGVLERLPLCDMPGRTPTAFFSVLRPLAHLPAHSGVSNARAIVHLPLIVPPGCSFRVGGETRAWVEGEPFAFDDTIEHEAWNTADTIRAVLILDVWNPHIAEAERALLRAFLSAADDAGFGMTRFQDL